MIDPVLRFGLDWLLPRRCVVCSRLGTGLCMQCAGRLAPPSPGPPPAGIDRVVALCAYDGVGRDLVLALKRGGRRDAVAEMGTALVAGLGVRDLTPTVTWAPTTPRRHRERGFDQAELLAAAVARAGGWPLRRLLRRAAPAQMGRHREDRLAGPRFAPAAAGRVSIGAPPVVVVVDDVITSGATLGAAAAALRGAGALHVVAAVIARAEYRR